MISLEPVQYQIPEDVVEGHRLGRHVLHDPESLYYVHTRSGRAIKTVLHDRHIPVLDQGDVGSCTAEAQVGELATDPLWAALSAAQQGSLNQALAYAMYSDEEVLDGNGPYPPNDYGSYGLTAAKVSKTRGLSSGYTHALTLAGLEDMLQDGPACIGINWYSSMDSPPSSGLLSIARGATVRGGHEMVVRGVDPVAQEFYGDNSWGEGWGPLGGSWRMGYATVGRLLDEDGDATRSLPLTVPAPVPDPLGAFFAVALPWAAQTRTRPDLVPLKAAILKLKADEGR